MCGLLGMVVKAGNGFTAAEEDCFKNLLFIDQLRGPDSTGVLAYLNDGSMEMMKEAVDASSMMMFEGYGAKDFREVSGKLFSKGRAVLGHNRKATVGKIGVETAHPFVVDNRFVFMHNGTLRNWKNLPSVKDTKAEYDVDSEALANHLVHDVTALETNLGAVEGAYACQWVDQKEEKLFLVRNNERPLWLATTSMGWIWCSEPGFIYAAAARNRIKVDKMEEIPVDTLYTMDLVTPSDWEVAKLTVKKALPSQVVSGKAGTTFKGGKLPRVSKSFFKKLQKKFINTQVEFWADDYVEKNYPHDTGSWLVWGSSNDGLSFPHNITTTINTTKYTIEKVFVGALLKGRIVQMDHNEADGNVILKVDSVTPVQKSCHKGTL